MRTNDGKRTKEKQISSNLFLFLIVLLCLPLFCLLTEQIKRNCLQKTIARAISNSRCKWHSTVLRLIEIDFFFSSSSRSCYFFCLFSWRSFLRHCHFLFSILFICRSKSEFLIDLQSSPKQNRKKTMFFRFIHRFYIRCVVSRRACFVFHLHLFTKIWWSQNSDSKHLLHANIKRHWFGSFMFLTVLRLLFVASF